jgi:hypothetical protein
MSSNKFECKDKQRFLTKERANREIFILMKESLGGVVDLRPYKCKHCKGFHLTSKIK